MSANDTPTSSSAIDRREALKKAAAAAGVVAWATPTVQALTPGVASAQGVTNCRPVTDITFLFTGSTCECTDGELTDPNCCSNHTFLVDGVGAGTCGENCGAVVSDFEPTSKVKNCDARLVLDTGECKGTATGSLAGTVECEDGTTWDCTISVTLPCTPTGCPGEIPATMACTIIPE